MLNRYPLWKYLLLLATTILSLVYAVPNFYVPDPAIQVKGQAAGAVVDATVLSQVEQTLKDAKIDYFGAEANGKSALIRFHSSEQQMQALKRVKQGMGDGYVVALNSAQTTPEWLRKIGGTSMNLGLDLAGGVHFLLEVDTASAIEKNQLITVDEFKEKLRKAKIRYQTIVNNENNIIVAHFKTAEFRDQAMSELRPSSKQFLFSKPKTDETPEDFTFNAELSELAIKDMEDYAISQNLQTLRNRVNELGVSEPIVQRQGRNRIIVELAGVQDPAEAKRIIGKTANLEFRLEAKPDAMVSSKEQFIYRSERDQRRGPEWLERQIVVTGDQVQDARSSFDSETNQPQVNITLDSNGGTKMNLATRNNIGRRLGILFIEYKTHTEFITNENGEQIEKQTQYIERKIISLATIQSALNSSFRTTGLNAPGEASELALLLRSGALAAPMHFVEERVIGPSLGAENIRKGVFSCLWGLLVVSVFMIGFYRLFGLFANIALTVNLFMLVTALSLVGATLTLPGIAGIVLTLGMAVDANVLIYARIKEEFKNGATAQQAIHIGYERAFITILDANVTTFIVGIILFAVGTGTVKGFAISLCIGIITSMFTSIMISRALANLVYGRRKNLQHISV